MMEISDEFVLALAREADAFMKGRVTIGPGGTAFGTAQLVAYTKMVAQKAAEAEREACAQLCEAQHEEDRPSDYAYRIRARGTGDQIQSKPEQTRMDTSNQVVTDEQIDEIFNSMPDGPSGFLKSWGYRQFAQRLLALRAMPIWQPQFDSMVPMQEELALEFAQEIAGPKGKPSRLPDAVRLLEMAEALYKAEYEARGTGGAG